MNIEEALELWINGKRKKVREACQKDPYLYIKVKDTLPKADKDFLMSRMSR